MCRIKITLGNKTIELSNDIVEQMIDWEIQQREEHYHSLKMNVPKQEWDGLMRNRELIKTFLFSPCSVFVQAILKEKFNIT